MQTRYFIELLLFLALAIVFQQSIGFYSEKNTIVFDAYDLYTEMLMTSKSAEEVQAQR